MTEQKNQDESRQSQWFNEIAQQSKKRISFDDGDKLYDYIVAYCEKHGWDSDLNHVDVSRVTHMRGLFAFRKFTGDISRWDVSKVEDMSHMFHSARFNGDLSQWDVSNVNDMTSMFHSARFNGDLSQWDVSKVEKINAMFKNSSFTGSIEAWNLKKLNSEGWLSLFDFSEYAKVHPNWRKEVAEQIARCQQTALEETTSKSTHLCI